MDNEELDKTLDDSETESKNNAIEEATNGEVYNEIEQGNKLPDPNNISSLSQKEYYYNEYNNLRILLSEYDKAILNISNHKSYTLNTGQTTQTVTRQDLSQLIYARKEILNQIHSLELFLGIGEKAVIKVQPFW